MIAENCEMYKLLKHCYSPEKKYSLYSIEIKFYFALLPPKYKLRSPTSLSRCLPFMEMYLILEVVSHTLNRDGTNCWQQYVVRRGASRPLFYIQRNAHFIQQKLVIMLSYWRQPFKKLLIYICYLIIKSLSYSLYCQSGRTSCRQEDAPRNASRLTLLLEEIYILPFFVQRNATLSCRW